MIKWLYNLGVENERRRIRDGLLLRLGPKPSLEDVPDWEYKTEAQRMGALGNKITGWYEAQDTILGYFEIGSEYTLPPDPKPRVSK